MAKRSLDYYESLNYRLNFYFSEEDKVWVVEYPELPGCIAHGETKEEALANADTAKRDWLRVLSETDRPIPEPRAQLEYSGRLLLRMPKSVHERLAKEAERENVSLNKLIVQIISEELGRRTGEKTAATATSTAHSVVQCLYETIKATRQAVVYLPLQRGFETQDKIIDLTRTTEVSDHVFNLAPPLQILGKRMHWEELEAEDQE